MRARERGCRASAHQARARFYSGSTERGYQVGSLAIGGTLVVSREGGLARVLCHQQWQRKHTTRYQQNDYPQCDSESQSHGCTFPRCVLHGVCQ